MTPSEKLSLVNKQFNRKGDNEQNNKTLAAIFIPLIFLSNG